MNPTSRVPSSGQDVRCVCGRLTARLEKQGLVVKCHRCGELVVISLADLKAQLNRATS